MPDRLGLDALAPLLGLVDTDPDPQVRRVALAVAARFPLDAQACAELATYGRTVAPSPAVQSLDAGSVAARIRAEVEVILDTRDVDARLALLSRLGQYGDQLSGRKAGATRGMHRGVRESAHEDPGGALPEERRVQLRIVQQGHRRRTFLAGAAHVIRCWIGPLEDDEIAANQPIPDVALPAEGLRLQAQLYWRDGLGNEHSDSQFLLLPAARDARSGDCDLHLTVPEGESFVAADIVFRYRGRIFEAVRLDAAVLVAGETETADHQVRLRVQASRREVLDIVNSPAVDGTLVLDAPRSPSADPGASLLLFDAHGAHAVDLGGSATALRWLNDTLHLTETAVVRRQARSGSPGTEELDADDPDVLGLLRTLARHGANLWNQLRDNGFRDPGERLQLLNRTRDHVPLEFVYDRGVPAEDARLCDGWREALQSDTATCPVCSRTPLTQDQRDNVATLCPLGFWSLQKVIERIDPDALPGSGSGASVPTAARRSLRPIDSALFACSDKVPEAERTRLWETLTQCVPRAARAADWPQWKAAMQADPALLLVLPHHDTDQGLDYLEIGADGLAHAQARLGREQLSPSYINPDATEPGPIVLMLGCQTATDTENPTGYTDLTRRVQQQHAAIVLGTLAKVLGRHAAPVAQELVRQLATVRDGDTDFGTVMRRVRRRMLGRGYLMALCLVALGDAQWRLAPLQADTTPAH
ncbi:hypothetical protein [Sphaerotilus sp.]|uniref:hypothetical protein n=1 Tax=Sphaerotilus sp. TaxID=2093942 RepID=UPI00286E90C7|nr:hypothetical protein [Sphaerotilus sp.]